MTEGVVMEGEREGVVTEGVVEKKSAGCGREREWEGVVTVGVVT